MRDVAALRRRCGERSRTRRVGSRCQQRPAGSTRDETRGGACSVDAARLRSRHARRQVPLLDGREADSAQARVRELARGVRRAAGEAVRGMVGRRGRAGRVELALLVELAGGADGAAPLCGLLERARAQPEQRAEALFARGLLLLSRTRRRGARQREPKAVGRRRAQLLHLDRRRQQRRVRLRWRGAVLRREQAEQPRAGLSLGRVALVRAACSRPADGLRDGAHVEAVRPRRVEKPHVLLWRPASLAALSGAGAAARGVR
mmetsp:Transcript_37307/g.121966  ORF Transcript_37307/g.121966 Transcript_37307/m.121966 type:complete len:261 (-) Transcript_37307:469-1251(-)